MHFISPGQTVAGLIGGFAIVFGGISAAWANPIPPDIYFIHVQALESVFCYQPPIDSCDEFVESTRLTGPLEFDLFRAPGGSWYCSHFDIIVTWPADWLFVGVDVCGDPDNSFTREGNTGILHVNSLEHPSGPWLQSMAQVALVVTSPGSFGITNIVGCDAVAWTPVHAGRECGECAWPCTWGPFGVYLRGFPFPYLDPAELEFQTEVGRTASDEIDVEVEYLQPGESVSFVPTEDWMSLDVEALPPGHDLPDYRVSVTADAESLDPGVYEGWIEVQRVRCSECARVTFTVLPKTAAEPETWGSVKNRYREGSE